MLLLLASTLGAAAPERGDSWATAGLKSAMLPGWGQYSRGETFKGKAFGVLAFAGWIGYAWAANDANAKINKYNSYAKEAEALKRQGQAFDAVRVDGSYREANAALLTSQIATAALATIYVCAIWDAVRGTPSVKQALFSTAPRYDGMEIAYARRF